MNRFEEYYKYKFEFKNIDFSLDRINLALKYALNTYNNNAKFIHIAGTNGKGSTSFFLAQMLFSAGYNVGLFTSPHIMKVNERISYNLKDISDSEINQLFELYENIIIQYSLSYFEGIFFLAMVYFHNITTDYIILETGLGGRLDATNTDFIPDKLCILTSISQDHTDYLGKNIYNIIDEKLGILRDNSFLIVAPNRTFIKEYIKSKCLKNNIIFVDNHNNHFDFPYNENFETAKCAYKILTSQDCKDINYKLPMCRLENINGIYLDGSHNPGGLLSLANLWKTKHIDAIIFTVTSDRDLEKTYTILNTITKNLIITTIPDNERSINNVDKKYTFFPKPEDALAFAERNYTNILITGSFYLCAYLRKILLDRGNQYA